MPKLPNYAVKSAVGSALIPDASTAIGKPFTKQATPLAAPAYGSNVAGFDANNAQHKALADAGQAWWTAKQSGDTAGMNAAAAQGQSIRGGLEGSTFNSGTGRSTLGTVGTGGFGATEAQNEIQAEIDALNQQSASAKSLLDYQVGQNNQYLADQLKYLEGAEAVAGDSAQQLQNRRGGFYSGGLDYQMGGIQRDYAGARGGLTRDIAGRNQQLLDQYGTQANQIASQLKTLQSTSPQLIRDRILQYQLQVAPLTGMFQGQQTMDAQNQKFNQDFQNKQYDRSVFESDRGYNYQTERDKIMDERDKRDFDEMVRQQGLDNAVQWFNANTSRQSSNNAAGNASYDKLIGIWNATGKAPPGLEAYGVKPGQSIYEKPSTPNTTPSSYKMSPDFAEDVAWINSNPDGALTEIQNNSAALIEQYGYEGYQELLKLATPKEE